MHQNSILLSQNSEFRAWWPNSVNVHRVLVLGIVHRVLVSGVCTLAIFGESELKRNGFITDFIPNKLFLTGLPGAKVASGSGSTSPRLRSCF